MTEQTHTLKLFNSLTDKVEDLGVSGRPVTYYSCGPTVYNHVHIGNLRAFVFYDLLRRSLDLLGYDVKHVMNLTDVDDKTIRRSRSEGVTLRALTDRYTEAFMADLKALRIKIPAVMPRATETIEEMIDLIQKLLDRGLAYKSTDGSVYFAVAKFEHYGQLIDLEGMELEAGRSERVAVDEYDKDNVADFALWKAYVEEDGDVVWDSPFGRGRPGWHLECSAMAMKFLGETIDIHTGGIDLKFPHHENEIAQSQGCTGKPFSRFFVHNRHLQVGGKKMSKSLNNFYTRLQLKEQAEATGRELRYALLKTHYRRELNFLVQYDEAGKPVSFDAVQEARSALARRDEFLKLLEQVSEADTGAGDNKVSALVQDGKNRFKAALADDLNISAALGVLFDVIGQAYKLELSKADAVLLREFVNFTDEVLQFQGDESGLPADLEALMAERAEARATKNWARSDEIRDLFKARGYDLKDVSGGGQRWRKL